jgi:hypothetical protein
MKKLTLDLAALTVQSFSVDPLASLGGVSLPERSSNTIMANTCCFSACSCPNTE